MVRTEPLTPNHQDVLPDESEIPAQIDIRPIRVLRIRKRQMIPGGTRVNRVPGEHRIDPRVEGDISPDPNKSIWNIAKGNVLPFPAGADSQRTRNVAIASNPHARPGVVFQEKWIPASADPAAGLEAAEGNRHRTIEFNGRASLASPRRRKR